MPPKKKAKSKAKSNRSSPGKRRASDAVPTRMKVLAVVLVVLSIAGIVTVKYLQTPRGRAVLLDRGIHTYYAQVQEDTGEALKDALEEFGLRRRITERSGFERVGKDTVRYLVWDVPCGESTKLVLVNVALTHAAQSVGARVRRSEESADGRSLDFRVGTDRFDTHRVTIHKTRPSEARAPAPSKPRPRVAIVIDDFGYNSNGVVDAMLTLDMPLTVAILPTLPYSQRVLERARELGRCVMLHLPMEPEEDVVADIPAVTTAMGEQEIAALVAKYVEGMPGIDGVNNHQGSRATADARVMRAVLQTLEGYDIFFLDSLTSAKSVAYNTARDVGVPTARNDLFLDADTEDAAVVEERLRRLAAMAQRNGSAIGIGHPHMWTLEAIRSNRTFFENAGVELVTISDLVE